MSAKGAGRSCLDTREAIKPMTPPLAWREAGPLASANSASTKYTEGHRYWPYCASTRLRGIQVHSTRTRQRHGLFFPFQAPCLVQVLLLLHMSAANTISSCKPGAHHRFLIFLLLLFLRHAHPWKCDAKIPLATDASMPHAACGSRQKSDMHGRHQSASWCACRIGPRSKPATQLVLLHDLDPPMAYLGQLCRRSRSSRAGVLADERWSPRKICSRLSVLLICTSISCMSQLDTVPSTRRAV